MANTGSYNILISSSGRRVSLLESFRESLTRLGLTGRVLAADCSRTAPTFHIADAGFEVPRCGDPCFIQEVTDICQEESVDLIVPTIDPELSVFAANRSIFTKIGTCVAVSSPETIAIGGDKAQTNRWLLENGFDAPRQWPWPLPAGEEMTYPLIVKPREGSASIGVYSAIDAEELQFLAQRVREPVIEEIVPGIEYTINVLVGRGGRVLSVIPHLRIEIRAGEVSKGVTTKDPRLLDLARRIAQALPGAFGALNFQCILGPDGVFRFIEINPRFGGGYPLAHKAGVDFPKWLIEETLGLSSTAHFDDWEDGLAMLRYDDAVYVRREALGQLP